MTRETKLGWIVAAVLASIIPITVVVSSLGDSPESVVEDYLEAVQRKDIDEALRITGRKSLSRDDPMRTPAALSSDWRIESVARRDEPEGTGLDDEDDTDRYLVDAVLSADDLSTRGGFVVTRQENGDWRIENPFADVLIDPNPVDFVELNGVVVPPDPVEDAEDAEDRLVPVRVFPGLYRPYADSPGISARLDRVLLAPDRENGPEQSRELDPSVAISPSGTEAIDDAVREHIDDCAARETPTLKDCPYLAADKVNVVYAGSDHYDDVADITWTIDEYPEVTATPGPDGFRLAADNDPVATMTATGRRDGEGPRVEFTTTCPIGLGGAEVHFIWPRATATLDSDGEATVTWTADEHDRFVLYECR